MATAGHMCILNTSIVTDLNVDGHKWGKMCKSGKTSCAKENSKSLV